MTKKVLILSAFLILITVINSCMGDDSVKTVSDLAYSRREGERTVCVPENGQAVPYIVLTDDYNGKTLLMRKEVLEEDRRINEYSALYENSEADVYLNGEFIDSLGDFSRYIVTSDISVADDSAIGSSGDKTKQIQRKVFLLSVNELGINMGVNAGKEGNALKYFADENDRLAYRNGKEAAWWLRSPNTYYLSCTYVIGDNNKLGYTNAYDKNGIRPVFCVSGELPIQESENENVYIFSDENMYKRG